jgi:TPR repeat protein
MSKNTPMLLRNEIAVLFRAWRRAGKADLRYSEGLVNKAVASVRTLLGVTLFMISAVLPNHGFAAPDITPSCAEDRERLRSIANSNDIKNIIDFRVNQAYDDIPTTGRRGRQEDFVTWRKFARKGVSNAQFMTGAAYLTGQRVKVDPKEALRWFSMASQKGDVEATFIVAYMYAVGSGTRVDYCKAKQMFCTAGAKGIEEAKYGMGTQCDE